MPALAPYLPDAFVGLVPVVAHPIDGVGDPLPEIVAGRLRVLVVEVEGIDELAVDIELELTVGGVADAHRARAAITFEVVERSLEQLLAAVDAVNDLEVGGMVGPRAMADPVDEIAGFVGQAQPDEPVERERGIAGPRVAVVPVAHAPDLFGKAEGGGGHDGAGVPAVQELQGQRGTMHLVTPAPPV